MIAIFDREADRLPIATMLRAMVKMSPLKHDEPLVLTRFGGVGEAVWSLETRLDAEESVLMSIEELLRIVSMPGQIVDELRCRNEELCFGVSDATFMFVQSFDKNIEQGIALRFRQVSVLPDQG